MNNENTQKFASRASGIKKNLINDAIRKLTLAKAKFKIIVEDGSEEFGSLEVVKEKMEDQRGNHRAVSYPYGTYTEIIKPIISTMELGDVVEFDHTKYGFEINLFRSAIASAMNYMYGSGSCKTLINKFTQKIEVMRQL